MHEVRSLEFQCNPVCDLGCEQASVEIPHAEVAFQEIFQTHFSHSRSCYALYQRILTLLPRQFNGYLAKRIFAQKYARLVNENFSAIENPCNESLFMSALEVEVVRARAVQNSALLARAVAVDVIFDAFVAASRLLYANSIVGHFSFSPSMSEDFSDFLFNNLGASSCSFNVESLPGAFQPIVTELYLAGTISANSVLWFANHSELEVQDETLDALEGLLEGWKDKYMSFLGDGTEFQVNLPGSMPEENVVDAQQVRDLPSLVAGVTSVFSRVGKGVLNVESTLNNTADFTASIAELTAI